MGSTKRKPAWWRKSPDAGISIRRWLLRGFLSGKQRLLTDKLAAILILADALDESRRGKITELKVRLEDSRLVVTARGREDLLLEKWAFGECVPYFEEVFGIRPVFVAKSNLI